MGALDEFPLRADDECKFATISGSNLPQMLDQLQCLGPMQIPGQFSVEQTLMEYRQLVVQVLAHDLTPRMRICSEGSMP